MSCTNTRLTERIRISGPVDRHKAIIHGVRLLGQKSSNKRYYSR